MATTGPLARASFSCTSTVLPANAAVARKSGAASSQLFAYSFASTSASQSLSARWKAGSPTFGRTLWPMTRQTPFVVQRCPSDVSSFIEYVSMVSGAFSKRQLLEEGFSTVRWDNGPSSGGWCAPQGMAANPANSTATTCGPAAQGVARLPASQAATDAYNLASNANNFHPRLPRYGRLTHDQDRVGLTGAVQWRPMQGSLVTFDMLYAKLDATRQEDFLEAISFSRSASQGGKPQTSVVEAQYAPNGNLLYGKFNGVDMRAESRFDKLSTTFTQPTLTLDQRLTDTLQLQARVGRATSRNTQMSPPASKRPMRPGNLCAKRCSTAVSASGRSAEPSIADGHS